jgi:hypothetical protein
MPRKELSMTDKSWFLSIVMTTACAVTTPPPAAPGPAAPPPPATAIAPQAVDNGQPKMHATLQALERAQHALQMATPNKGGHREKALEIVAVASSEVQAGIEYANAHPTEVGTYEPPSPLEPVDEEVKGAKNQQNMAAAMVELREAHKQLSEAKGDKGGHRVKALQMIKDAEKQVREGIKFANHHG